MCLKRSWFIRSLAVYVSSKTCEFQAPIQAPSVVGRHSRRFLLSITNQGGTRQFKLLKILSAVIGLRRQHMHMRRVAGCCMVTLLSVASLYAASADLADAVMKGNKAAVRALLQKKADVNAAQSDGTTALHWAARLDDLEMADLLIHSGANVSAATRGGATPLELAAVNGSAAMIEKLIKAGADVNARLTKYGDTALMMAARTGKPDAVKVLLDNGAQINSAETGGGTTA